MYKFWALGAVSVLILSAVVPASAETITQTKSYSGTPGFTQTLTFNEFDTQGGTRVLQSIQILFDLCSTNGSLKLDNDGATGASGDFEFGAEANLTSGDVDLKNSSNNAVVRELEAISGDAFTLAADDGDGVDNYDFTAPDGLVYTGVPVSDDASGLIGSSYFYQFTGVGTYNIFVNASTWSDYGGIGGIEYAVTPPTVSGDVTVKYNYVTIPEPATAGLVVLGGVALLIRRRNRRTA